MENNGQSVVNPIITFLTEILDSISAGELRVPNFQRPYVWKPIDALSLFDSIYKGYPIGSVLFWETTEKLISFTQIGPFNLELIDRTLLNYVIDGHQRLSTLFGILKSKKNMISNDLNRWEMYFDLDKEEFFFRSTSTKVANYIAMNKVMNPIDFLDECKRIQTENPIKAEFLISRAQKLTQTIVTYKIAITQIKKGNLSSAVEIFSRLNTRGMDITPDQMLSALTYKEGENAFKLSDRIDDILNNLIEYNFSEIERVFVFRAIIAATRRDIYSAKLEDLADDRIVRLPEIVDKCEASIIYAVKFLRNHVKVPSDKLLPYNLQLVFLSLFYFVQPYPTNRQLDELIKWFWFTSYSGWFAGANSSKIRKGLEDMRAFALRETPQILNNVEYLTPTAEIPEKFDFRYARIKAFILFLNLLEPKSISNPAESLENELISYGSKALHNIVPHEVNAFANKMILGPVRSGYAKSELVENSIWITDEILNSHAITFEGVKALEDGDYKKFLSLRQIKLIQMEQDFIESLGLTYKIPGFKTYVSSNQFDLFGFEQ